MFNYSFAFSLIFTLLVFFFIIWIFKFLKIRIEKHKILKYENDIILPENIEQILVLNNEHAVEIIDATINFVCIIMKDNRLKKTISYKLSSKGYRHFESNGYYSSKKNGKGKILIQLKKNKTIYSLVGVVLHEMCHHMQYRKDQKNFDAKYDLYEKKLGYQKNPYEVEAIEFKARWLYPCLKYQYAKKQIYQ